MSAEPALVEVVGAGPAGLAAAITLARGGRRVVVHEARRDVGLRFRRDLQGLENWSGTRNVLDVLHDAGLTTQFDTAPCARGTAFDAWGARYPLSSGEPIFYLVERGPQPGSLDRALLDQALSLGVEVRFGSRRQRLDGAGIFASGPRMADAIAVGYHFDTRLADGFWIILDDTLAPAGYAYLLAMGARATLKCCLFRDFARWRQYVERTVERFRALVGFDMRAARLHAGIGNFFVPPSACPGLHPIAGEAAGFQDAFAGFGMRYAMLSGVMAARSLLDGTDYDRSWRQAIERPMLTARVNRAIYQRLGNRGYRWLLRTQACTGDSRAFLRWLYRPARVRRALLPWAQRRSPAVAFDAQAALSRASSRCRQLPG